MKRFKTRRHLERYMVVLLVFILPLFIFLKYPVILKITFLLPIFVIPLLSITDLIVDNKKIIIHYPFLKIVKKNIILWDLVESLKINFREGITHGALMPSYIEIVTKDGKSSKVYYKLSMVELKLFKDIVESKGKILEIINNPYD